MTGRFSIKKLVSPALLAALACIAAMPTRIPIPGTGGYIHPSDTIVVLCGVFLDPVPALSVTGIGPCMADLPGGRFIYVPIIFVIKGLVVSSASHVCRSLGARGINPYAAVAGCGVIDTILAAGGYYVCEVLLYRLGAALASVPSNITRGINGLITSSALYPVLQKSLSMALKA